MVNRVVWSGLEAHGWTPNIIPVIPPGAELALGSKLQAAVGKVPGLRLPNHTWQGFPSWRSAVAGPDEIRCWSQWADANIGLRCHDLCGVDIDCEDHKIADALEAFLLERYPGALVRWRANSARRLVLLRVVDGDAPSKLRLTLTAPDGQVARVELLGWGNQFVAYGVHPSGVEYQWRKGPHETAREAASPIGAADVAELAGALRAFLLNQGCEVQPISRIGHGLARGGERKPLGDPAHLAQDFDQAGRALMQIPNTPVLADGVQNQHSDTHDRTLRYIAAFMGAVGGDQAAIDAYLVPWLEQWPDNTADYIRGRIASFRGGVDLGARALFACARSWGFQEVPAGEFEPVTETQIVDIQQVRDAKARLVVDNSAAMTVPAIAMGPTWSDSAQGQFFWQSARERIAYHPAAGWMIWDRISWRADRVAVEHEARHYLDVQAQQVENAVVQKWLGDAARPDRLLKTLVARARIMEWDRDPFLLNTPGGVYDLRTGLLRATDSKQYMRRSCAVAPVGEAPAAFNQMLDTIFEDRPTLRQLLIDFMALALIGVPLRPLIVWLEGKGSNGKSLLIALLSRMLGVGPNGYAYDTAEPTMFGMRHAHRAHSSDLAETDGRRFIAFNEVERDWKANEALLKAAAAGEAVTARTIREPEYTFKFSASILFASNEPLKCAVNNEAMRRRFVHVPMLRKFKEDGKFAAAVLADAPRVLMLLIHRVAELLNGAVSPLLEDTWDRATLEQRAQYMAIKAAGEQQLARLDSTGFLLKQFLVCTRRQTHRVSSRQIVDELRRRAEQMLENAVDEMPGLEDILHMPDDTLSKRIAQAIWIEHGVKRSTYWEDEKAHKGYLGFTLNLSDDFLC